MANRAYLYSLDSDDYNNPRPIGSIPTIRIYRTMIPAGTSHMLGFYCTHLLKQMEAADAMAANVISAIGCYSNFECKDKKNFRLNTVGATLF